MKRATILLWVLTGAMLTCQPLYASGGDHFTFQLQIPAENIREISDPVTERPLPSPLCMADDPRTSGDFTKFMANNNKVYYFENLIPDPLPGFKVQTCLNASEEYFTYDGETIVNLQSGECLTLIDDSPWLSLTQPIGTIAGVAEVTSYDARLTGCNGGDEQKWEIDAADGGDSIVLYNRSLSSGQCQVGVFTDGGAVSIEQSPLFRTQTFMFVREFCFDEPDSPYRTGWKHRSDIAQLERINAVELAWLPAVLHLML